jgi:secreted protein with Ig-like and vWFA domain
VWDPVWKTTKAKRTDGFAQVIKHLPKKYENLRSNPNTNKNKTKLKMNSSIQLCFMYYGSVYSTTAFADDIYSQRKEVTYRMQKWSTILTEILITIVGDNPPTNQVSLQFIM